MSATRSWWGRVGLLAVLGCYALSVGRAHAGDTLDIYFIDVGRGVGNATLIVAPSGESLVLDAGLARQEWRMLDVLKHADVKQIDYLLNTHFHADHFGAAAKLAEQVRVKTFVDHGPSVEFGKSEEWWKERRGPWFREGMGKTYDTMYQAYVDARKKSLHQVVRPGDTVPVKGIDVKIVCAGGKILTEPLPGAGGKNPAGTDDDRRADDDAEDAQSIGVLVSYGTFRFVYLGDLTWNIAHALFYPRNLVGTADAYLITHHAQSLPKSMGAYYYGLSSCPKAEVHGLRPRVAFLSLGALGHRQGTADAMQVVRSSPGLEDVWQTEFIEAGGEKDHNSPKDFIANRGERTNEVRYIKLSASRDGSFRVTNCRNGFTKKYAARTKP